VHDDRFSLSYDMRAPEFGAPPVAIGWEWLELFESAVRPRLCPYADRMEPQPVGQEA
jgi:hypothetical protein